MGRRISYWRKGVYVWDIVRMTHFLCRSEASHSTKRNTEWPASTLAHTHSDGHGHTLERLKETAQVIPYLYPLQLLERLGHVLGRVVVRA